MDIQRLRNLTTGILHTQVGDVYADIEMLTGEGGVMTHHLPDAVLSLEPYLRDVAPDLRLWDGVYDPLHVGDVFVPPMTADQLNEFFKRFRLASGNR